MGTEASALAFLFVAIVGVRMASRRAARRR